MSSVNIGIVLNVLMAVRLNWNRISSVTMNNKNKLVLKSRNQKEMKIGSGKSKNSMVVY